MPDYRQGPATSCIPVEQLDYQNPAPAPTGATVRCGGRSCELERQICCGSADEGFCLDRPTLVPTELSVKEHEQLLVTQRCVGSLHDAYLYRQCQAETARRAVAAGRADPSRDGAMVSVDLRFCDDLGDCPAGHACCREGSDCDHGADFFQCRRVSRDDTRQGGSVCSVTESCVAAGPCRAPAATCVQDTCRARRASVVCGSKPCGSVCCVPEDRQSGSPQCLASLPCPSGFFHEGCDGPEDCLPGEYCCASAFGPSACTGWCEATVRCARGAVCAGGAEDCSRCRR